MTSTKLCRSCGSEIQDGSPFCPSCGAAAASTSVSKYGSADSSSRFCGFCGVKISSHVIYCPECGKLQPEELSEPDEGGLSAAAVARSPQTEPQIPSPPVSPKTHAQNKVLKSEPVRVKVAPKPVSRMPVPAPQRATEPRRPSDEPDQILIVRDLSIVKGKKQIVQGIEFSVNRGEIVGILGPSGSGKSTIIKAITSESTGVAGQLIMGGFDLAREAQSAKEILGYVPQETQLYEDLSFGQNVMYFGSQYGLDKAYLAERAQKLAAVVDLGDRLNDKVGRLSGGQKKRVSVATALAHEPELVILDEPTSGLDPATRRSLWRFLKSVNQTYNVSMVVTTHFLDEGEYCDRLLIINKGRMVAYETPRTLKQSIPGAGKTIELEMFTLDDYVSAKLGEFESKVKQEGVADLVDRSGYKVKVFCKDISLAMAKIPILLGELGLGFKAMNVVDTSLEDVFIYFTGETFQEAS